MYEIWLAMNIVYEIALSVAPWLAVLLLGSGWCCWCWHASA